MMRAGFVWKLVINAFSYYLNVFLLTVLLQNKKLRANRSNKHICNILLSHVLLSLSYLIEICIPQVHNGEIALLFFYMCLYNLGTLSYDRFVAVMFPYRYLNTGEVSRKLLLAFSWVFGATIFALTVTTQDTWRLSNFIFSGVSFFGILLLMLLVNIVIFFTARRHQKQILKEISQTDKKVFEAKKESYRLVCACFAAVVTLFVCNIPSVLGGAFIKNKKDSELWLYVTSCFVLCAICEAFLFVRFNSGLRIEAQRILKQLSSACWKKGGRKKKDTYKEAIRKRPYCICLNAKTLHSD